jgi:drug/metabolite transporter (DMT)-like permease
VGTSDGDRFLPGSLPFSLFALGEQRISSALAGIGNSITPIATVLFSLLLLPVDKIAPRKIVGVLIGFAGVLVIMQPWASLGRPDLLGFGMTLVAGTSYGLGWIYTKRFLGRADFGGLTLPAAQMLTSAAQMLAAVAIWWLTQRSHLSLAAPWSLYANTSGGSVLVPLLAVLALGSSAPVSRCLSSTTWCARPVPPSDLRSPISSWWSRWPWACWCWANGWSGLSSSAPQWSWGPQ